MAGVHCYTGVTLGCLDRARVLAETVRKHHPEWTLWLCLADREPAGFRFDLAEEPFDHLVRIDQLEIPNLDQWIFAHDAAGLSAAVKGPMLGHVLARGADKVLCLDASVALFDSLTEVCDLLDRHTIVMPPPSTPFEAEGDGARGRAMSPALDAGDSCFIAVKGGAEGTRFARRWRDRLVEVSGDGTSAGMSPHRHLRDLIPSFAAGTYVLRDPGFNAGCANLARCPIEITLGGSILAGGSPLRVFRFTDIDPRNEASIEHHCGGRPEIFELLRWYRERLAAHAVRSSSPG